MVDMFEDIDDEMFNVNLTPMKEKSKQNGSVNPFPFYQNIKDCKTTPNKSVSPKNKPVKRKFPGPAGILPDEDGTSQTENLGVFCSQENIINSQNSLWQQVERDFSTNNIPLTHKFNVAWIKREASLNKLTNHKAPFLAAVLHSLMVADEKGQKSTNITLKDQTGTIQGTILQNVYDEHVDHLITGSIIVLKQFGVLCCSCDKCDNHHLTITSNNLAVIYSIKNVSVEKVVINCVNPDEVLTEYNMNIFKQEKSLKQNVHNEIGSFVKKDDNIHNCGRVNTVEKMMHSVSKKIKNVYKRNTNINNKSIPGTTLKPVAVAGSIPKFIVQKPNSIVSKNTVNEIQEQNVNTLLTENTAQQNQLLVPGNNLSIKVDKSEHTEIWQKLFDEVDVDSILSDF